MDNYSSYSKINENVWCHISRKVNPKDAGKALPWVHTMISNAKRTLLGVYHIISTKYSQNYLDEFCYKVNRRNFGEQLIGLRYDNMLFSKYWHGGSALVNRPSKSDITLKYYTSIPTAEAKIWNLNTASPNSLYAKGFLDQTTTKNEMLLTLDGSNIPISSVTGSTYVIQPEGTSTFNKAKLLHNRKIFLNYKFVNTVNGYTYHCKDTLTFRNRIRDSVNE